MTTDRELMEKIFNAIDSINDFSSGSYYAGVLDYEVKLLRERLAQPDLAAVGEAGVWGERQWQGLTDEEIDKIEMSASSILSAIYITEAQLKGKNA